MESGNVVIMDETGTKENKRFQTGSPVQYLACSPDVILGASREGRIHSILCHSL